jgi:CheY-specific phosphatase CheX
MTSSSSKSSLMNVEHARPFLHQTVRTFEMMIGVRPVEMEMNAKEVPEATHDVSAMQGLSGPGTGGVVLSFPELVACKVANCMLDETYDTVNQDVTDCVGELVNIIVGNAKRDLVKFGYVGLSASLPHVIVGKHRSVWHTRDIPCLMTQFFLTEFGPFSIEVNLRPSDDGAANSGSEYDENLDR